MDTNLITVGISLAVLIVTLAGLIIGLFAWLRTDIHRLGDRLDNLGLEMRQESAALRGEVTARLHDTQQQIGGVQGEIAERFERLDGRLRAVEHGQAKLEGLLEGLREAIAGRNAA